MKIPIAHIEVSPDVQPREEIDSALIQEYAEAMQGGDVFPAVTVFDDSGVYWLADGFHRVYAAKVAKRVDIDAEVRKGSERDAILFAAGANADHGKRRTNADKRRAVMRLLQDDEWGKWSANEIARRCRVGPDMVGDRRRSLSETDSDNQSTVTYPDRWGNTSEMDVSNIGRSGDNGREDEPLPFDEPIQPPPVVIQPEPPPQHTPVSKFNPVNENIDWAAWSWNPVTGCKHGCPYCYAKTMAERFYR